MSLTFIQSRGLLQTCGHRWESGVGGICAQPHGAQEKEMKTIPRPGVLKKERLPRS